MKKRRMTGFAALFLLLIFIFPLNAFAAENTGQSGTQITLTVSVPGYPADVEGGAAQTTLPDGSRVAVQGEVLPDGLLFVVEPLEAGTLAWIESCMEGKGTNLRGYDIYFLDDSGNRYEITEPITVSFSLNGEYRNPAVYYICESGETQKMETSVNEDQISFITDHNSYYALAEQVETAEPEEPGKPETPEEPDAAGGSGSPSGSPGETGGQSGTGGTDSETSGGSGEELPKTGDMVQTGLWAGMMAVSVILVFTLVDKKRKQII